MSKFAAGHKINLMRAILSVGETGKLLENTFPASFEKKANIELQL